VALSAQIVYFRGLCLVDNLDQTVPVYQVSIMQNHLALNTHTKSKLPAKVYLSLNPVLAATVACQKLTNNQMENLGKVFRDFFLSKNMKSLRSFLLGFGFDIPGNSDGLRTQTDIFLFVLQKKS